MEEKKNKGGRKKKPDDQKKKIHQVYATDTDWAKIKERAEKEQMEVSPYIIKKALQ